MAYRFRRTSAGFRSPWVSCCTPYDPWVTPKAWRWWGEQAPGNPKDQNVKVRPSLVGVVLALAVLGTGCVNMCGYQPIRGEPVTTTEPTCIPPPDGGCGVAVRRP